MMPDRQPKLGDLYQYCRKGKWETLFTIRNALELRLATADCDRMPDQYRIMPDQEAELPLFAKGGEG
jgi:hypothetical protein